MALGDGMSALGVAPDMWKQIDVRELQADIMRNAAQAQTDALTYGNAMAQHGAQQAHAQNVPSMSPVAATTKTTNILTLSARARELFLKRMGGIRAEMLIAPGDFLQCHIHGEMVHVFFCFSGKPGVTQESIDLFPSDMLITQFRMILS